MIGADLDKNSTMTVGDFLDEFSLRQDELQAYKTQGIRSFLHRFEQEYHEIPGSQREVNIFEILGIVENEVKHSAFVAWMLNPRASHGQGSLFLQQFVKACGLSILPGTLSRCRVYTEYALWDSIPDIVIYGYPSFIIFVENKVRSSVDIDQLMRESRDLDRVGSAAALERDRLHRVLLTPAGLVPSPAKALGWVPLSYSDLGYSLDQCLPAVDFQDVASLIRTWLRTIAQF